jgi:flagellar biosynthetic protein FlhB
MIDDPSGFRIRTSADAIDFMAVVGASSAQLVLPMVIVLALAGLASSFLQNAPRIVFERIKPEFSRISIAQGGKGYLAARGVSRRRRPFLSSLRLALS